jgi:hypothetical protein
LSGKQPFDAEVFVTAAMLRFGRPCIKDVRAFFLPSCGYDRLPPGSSNV